MPSQFHNVSDDAFIRLLGLSIENGRADDLQPLLAPRGYDLAALDGARAERDAFVEALRHLRDLKGEAKTAARASGEARAAFHGETYMVHVELARIALRDNHAALVSLGLNAPRARSYAAWHGQASQFYHNALARPDALAALAARGLGAAELQDAQAALGALDALALAAISARAAVTDATAERRRRRAALTAWLSDFRGVARVALRERPEWLERLGIRYRSRS